MMTEAGYSPAGHSADALAQYRSRRPVAEADDAAGAPPLPPPVGTPSPIGVSTVEVDIEGQQRAAEMKPQVVGREFFIGGDEDAETASAEGTITLTPEDEARHTQAARLVSGISLVASCSAALLGLGIGFNDEMLSLVGFGLEALLDALSSALVLWRFKKPKQRKHQDEEAAARFKATRDTQRERNSGIGIGATFVASAALLLLSATYKLLSWDPNDTTHMTEEHDGAIYAVLLSLPSAVIFGLLAVWKFRLGRALGSQVLEKDALCSVLGAVLALICAVAGIIEQASGDAEKMVLVDVVAGAVIATVLLLEGSRTLWHNLGQGWEKEHRQLA